MSRAFLLLLGVAVFGAAMLACDVDGLAFRQDRRIDFVAPRYREVVHVPVIVTWRIDEDLARSMRTGGAGQPVKLGVLIDVDPQPPGEPMAYFARNDESCRIADGCPDARYLAERRIYTTTETAFTIEALPAAPGVNLERGEKDLHEFVLILLDGDDRRVGESAWTLVFELRRQAEEP